MGGLPGAGPLGAVVFGLSWTFHRESPHSSGFQRLRNFASLGNLRTEQPMLNSACDGSLHPDALNQTLLVLQNNPMTQVPCARYIAYGGAHGVPESKGTLLGVPVTGILFYFGV